MMTLTPHKDQPVESTARRSGRPAAPTGKHVAVVGGGLGGLASACVLAARGYQVTVVEQNDWVGGKAAVLEADGFRFDMGPTILTLPSVLVRIFAEAGRDLSDYLNLLPLDPQWRCFFEPDARSHQEAAVLDLVANTDAMRENILQLTQSPSDADGYRDFLDLSARLHEISERFFFWRSVGGIADTINVRESFSAKVLKDVLALRMGQSVSSVVRRHVPDHRVSQMMDHFTQYVGSSPYASPAVLCGIAHMQTREGIWYPNGGTRAVPTALEKLAGELGVEIWTGTDVIRIETSSNRVTGITTVGGETIHCDAVISNCDAVRTYRELLSPSPQGKRLANSAKFEPACSGVVLYLGLKKRYEQLLHHNFVFSKDPEAEFESIYRSGQPAADPSIYVCAPAVTDPKVAPPGGESLYLLVHTPYLRPDHDWQRILPDYREVILDKLERTTGIQDLRAQIVFESSLTPEDIHHRYRVLNGAIYGLASHGKFFGAFKPANRRSDIRGLYLAGGAAHPGPGMPMVMMSGWIAADSLDQDLGK